MAWKGIQAEGETINDGGRKLKIGTFPYLITAIALVVKKSDNTGKEQQVVVDLRQGDDYNCKLYLGVMSDNDVQREIAEKTLRSIAQACGIAKGLVSPTTLKKLVDHYILIEASETVSKTDKTKSYVNINTVEAYDGDDDEEPEEEEEEEEEEEDPEEEEEEPEEEEEEAEEEEEEDEKPSKPAKPVKSSKPAKKDSPW